MLSKKQKLQIAVSYWGKNALKETGLGRRVEADPKSVQVICDLWSGACNPTPIQSLIRAGVEVKTLDHFHAKVWVCGGDTLIGSANASSNGLGFDTKKSVEINIEAAVGSLDKEFAKSVRHWFEKTWRSRPDVIEQEEIDHAKKFWSDRKNSQDRQRAYSKTLLQKLAQSRSVREFDNVFVLAWEGEGTHTPVSRQNYYEKHAMELYRESEQDKRRWFYDCRVDSKWKFTKGNLYLDFTIPENGKVSQLRFNGIYRIVSDSFLTAEDRRELVPYYMDTTCKGYWFPKREQNLLQKSIVEQINKSGRDSRDQEGRFLEEKLTNFWKK